MAFTTTEVNSAIEEFGEEEFIEAMAYRWGQNKTEPQLSIGQATYVDGKLGEEGGGENIWFVFKVGDQHFRITGWYSSYDGSNWEDLSVEAVKPQEKIVTIYVVE